MQWPFQFGCYTLRPVSYEMAFCHPPLSLRSTAINSFSGSAEGNPSYVLDLASDPSQRLLAVAGSEFDISLYDRASLKRLGTLGAPTAHSDRVNEVTFRPGSTTLYSASSDGTINGWDCRAVTAGLGGGGSSGVSSAPSLSLKCGKDEVWSVSAGEGHLVAAGTQTAVVIWDVRSANKALCRWEVHTDAVSQVPFSSPLFLPPSVNDF